MPVWTGRNSAFAIADDEHALDFFLVRAGLLDASLDGAAAWTASLSVLLLAFKIAALSERSGPEWEWTALLARGRRDLRGGGKSGTQVLRRVLQRDHDLEILGFLAGRSLLRRGDAGGADDGVVADLGDDCLENLLGNGVDGDFGGLSQTSR